MEKRSRKERDYSQRLQTCNNYESSFGLQNRREWSFLGKEKTCSSPKAASIKHQARKREEMSKETTCHKCPAYQTAAVDMVRNMCAFLSRTPSARRCNRFRCIQCHYHSSHVSHIRKRSLEHQLCENKVPSSMRWTAGSVRFCLTLFAPLICAT